MDPQAISLWFSAVPRPQQCHAPDTPIMSVCTHAAARNTPMPPQAAAQARAAVMAFRTSAAGVDFFVCGLDLSVRCCMHCSYSSLRSGCLWPRWPPPSAPSTQLHMCGMGIPAPSTPAQTRRLASDTHHPDRRMRFLPSALHSASTIAAVPKAANVIARTPPWPVICHAWVPPSYPSIAYQPCPRAS
jgi:hypothetical protein